MKKSTLLKVSTLMLLALISCKKETKTESINPVSVSKGLQYNSSGIAMKDGLLHFKSRELFEKASDINSNKEKLNIPENFESLSDLYNKVIDAEVKHFSSIDEKDRDFDKHSKFYNDNIKSVRVENINGERVLEMNIFSKQIADLIDKNGLVFINDTLYCYTKNEISFMEKYNDATLEKIRNYGIDKDEFKIIGSIGKPLADNSSTQKVFCDYCYTEFYRYNTLVFNNDFPKKQYILEVFLTQIRTLDNYNPKTSSEIKVRTRFLTLEPITGTWINGFSTDIYLSGAFSGPRSPSGYYESNPFTDKLVGYGTDFTTKHCWDEVWCNTSCFTTISGVYQMQSPYSPFTNLQVWW